MKRAGMKSIGIRALGRKEWGRKILLSISMINHTTLVLLSNVRILIYIGIILQLRANILLIAYANTYVC